MKLFNRRLYLPVAAFIFAGLHLFYEYFTGGIVSHHLLAREDLPAISNAFGLITLPLLALLVNYRAQSLTPASKNLLGYPASMMLAIIASIVYGGVMAGSYELGAASVTQIAFFGLFIIGLFLPVYRVEYLFGFVCAMTVTFGGVLPLIIGLVVACISFIAHFLTRKVKTLFINK